MDSWNTVVVYLVNVKKALAWGTGIGPNNWEISKNSTDEH